MTPNCARPRNEGARHPAEKGETYRGPTILLVTGASGFIGRYVVAALQKNYRIHALARRSPCEARAPVGPNITWHQVDLGDDGPMDLVFSRIAAAGGAEFVLHLAAYYDFGGKDDPEYQRTNVKGLRAVLTRCRALRPRQFTFVSSLAASEFPAPGMVLNEQSPVNGKHPYARSKRQGEALVAEFAGDFLHADRTPGRRVLGLVRVHPAVHLAAHLVLALVAPKILAGKGTAALPYIHVRDVVAFFARVLERADVLGNGEVLIASPDQAASHRQLFEGAMAALSNTWPKPTLMPKVLIGRASTRSACSASSAASRPLSSRGWPTTSTRRCRWTPARPASASAGSPTRALGCCADCRSSIIENQKTQAQEWHRRNVAAMKHVQVPNHLRIFQLIEDHEPALVQAAVELCLSQETSTRF